MPIDGLDFYFLSFWFGNSVTRLKFHKLMADVEFQYVGAGSPVVRERDLILASFL